MAETYGIPVSQTHLATSAEEACEISQKLGYPIELKISSPEIVHKADIGGVKIGLNNAGEVKEAFKIIIENTRRSCPNTRIYGVEVQKMMPKGIELIIGMSKDKQFGPKANVSIGSLPSLAWL
ncbi:MAG: hypothetical protein GX764_07885 [Firmicutes bacterium]|nr:hypothetical protein [Bacillota bacterium]